jgi:hypothetical protein
MKRLTILTVIAMMTLATTGCCRTWSLFRWTRGDDCTTCGDMGPYDSVPMSAGYGGQGYQGYEGAILPPPTTVLPGPLPTGQ